MNRLLKLSILATFVLYGQSALAIPDNLHMYGTLVEEPCTIKPGDDKIPLLFGNVPDKNLYNYGRTASRKFSINLSDCDTTIGKTVKITFSGTENTELPGYLAIISSSAASGFAIGIEDENGNQLNIDQAGDKVTLQDGSMQLNFNAFLKGEPNAVANMDIKRGPFNAVATFKLDYE